jgi:TetR/AcrR family fatty acid metabolism transcriptional regulator
LTVRSNNKPDGQNNPSFIQAARRAQIIECAIEVIATLGYTRASLARIAEQAGISKGVVLYYFKNKEVLIEQVVIEVYTEAARAVTPHIAAQPTTALKLQAYISSALEYIRTHREQLIALFEIVNHHRNTSGKLRFREEIQEPILVDLEALLRTGQQEGDFRSFDPRVMAVTIRRAMDAVPSHYAANPDLDVSAYSRELVTLFDRATRKE